MFVSLSTHSSTVESARCARNTTQYPIVPVSTPGVTSNAAGGGGGGGRGGGGCTLGAFESVQAQTPPAAIAAVSRSAEIVVRLMAEQAAHVPYRDERLA